MWCCRRRAPNEYAYARLLDRTGDPLPTSKRFLEGGSAFFSELNGALQEGPVFLKGVKNGDMRNIAIALANQGQLVLYTFDGGNRGQDSQLFIGRTTQLPMINGDVYRGIHDVIDSQGRTAFLDALLDPRRIKVTYLLDNGDNPRIESRGSYIPEDVPTIVARWTSKELPPGAVKMTYLKATP